jgi:hypothetical protein
VRVCALCCGVGRPEAAASGDAAQLAVPLACVGHEARTYCCRPYYAVSVSFRIAHSSHRSPSASLPAHRLQCRASASHWSAVAHGHESAAAIRWAHCTIRQLWERTVGVFAQSPGPRVRTASGAGPALMLPFHRGTDQTVEGPHSLMRASVALDSGLKSLSSLRTICILSRSAVVRRGSWREWAPGARRLEGRHGCRSHVREGPSPVRPGWLWGTVRCACMRAIVAAADIRPVSHVGHSQPCGDVHGAVHASNALSSTIPLCLWVRTHARAVLLCIICSDQRHRHRTPLM